MPRLTKAQKLAKAAEAQAAQTNVAPVAAASPRVAPANNGNLQPLASNVSLAVIAEHGAAETGVDIAALRLAAAKLYNAIAGTDPRLCPVKALAKFGYKKALGCDKNQNPSDRNCATIAVAAIASGIAIKPGSVLPRKFTLFNAPFAAENGATADAHFAGIVNYNAENETFTITQIGAREILERHGKRLAAINVADLL